MSGLHRPMMPTAADQARSIHQFARLQILMEEWDDILEEWRGVHIGAERAQVWGPVDTSSNTLADMARQLSTPGLYGRRPKWRNRDARAEALTGDGGLYDRAGWFSKMPYISYLTLGLGDWFTRWNVDTRGRFTAELVPPHDVFLVEDQESKGRAVELWRLRRLLLEPEGTWIYGWEVYDLGRVGPAGGFTRPPSYRIYEATNGAAASNGGTFAGGGLGADLSHRFVFDPTTGAAGALVGDRYPWISEVDGLPRFPWAHHKDADTGQLWNTFTKRGAHRGALNAALYWTYAGHCARDATGSYVIVAGLQPGNITTVIDSSRQGFTRDPVAGSVPVQTKLITPGAIDYHEQKEDQTPFVHEVGPGVNLPDVVEFADRYEMKQATRWGLNPSDLSRSNANPSSAAALMVSNEGKREFAAQVEGIFRSADLAGVEAAAIVARVGGLGSFPERGYSIEYQKIARSPAEDRERREDLTWQQDQGMMSKIDVYRELNPGTTEADATAALVEIALTKARIKAASGEALKAAGLAETTAATDIELAPTDIAAIVKVNEARAQEGLAPIAGGEATVSEYKAGAIVSADSTTETNQD